MASVRQSESYSCSESVSPAQGELRVCVVLPVKVFIGKILWRLVRVAGYSVYCKLQCTEHTHLCATYALQESTAKIHVQKSLPPQPYKHTTFFCRALPSFGGKPRAMPRKGDHTYDTILRQNKQLPRTTLLG